MRQTLPFFLVAALVFTLTACAGRKPVTDPDPKAGAGAAVDPKDGSGEEAGEAERDPIEEEPEASSPDSPFPGSPFAALESKPTGEQVSFVFGWKPGVEAQVDSSRKRTRTTAGTEQASGGAVTYTLQVSSHAEGLLLRSRDPKPGKFYPENQAGASLESVLSRMLPDAVVGLDGEFVRLENTASMREALLSLVKDVPPAVRSQVDQMMSDEAITGLYAQEWALLVTSWAGSELELGEVYSAQSEASMPMFPGTTVTMQTEFSVVGRTPCAEGEREARCVEVQLRSQPDPEQVSAFLQRFFDKTMKAISEGKAGPLPLFEDLEMANSVTLVTEPGTLLPHRIEKGKWFRAKVKIGDESQEAEQLEMQRATYRYKR